MLALVSDETECRSALSYLHGLLAEGVKTTFEEENPMYNRIFVYAERCTIEPDQEMCVITIMIAASWHGAPADEMHDGPAPIVTVEQVVRSSEAECGLGRAVSH